MKQYRVTSDDFVPKNPGVPDAFMDSVDLTRLKQLAGVYKLVETSVNVQQDHDEPFSPVGTVNNNLTQKRQIEKQLNIKTGTPEWFRLYFARPELTGEKPVGDDLPETEPNPSYLLGDDGLPDSDKVAKLADKLEKRWHDEKHQAATASNPKY